MSGAVVLAIDIGGTSLKGALVDAAGGVIHREPVPLDGRTGDAAFAAVRALAGRLKAGADRDGRPTLGAGVVAPGVDETSGRVLFASNLGWRDLPLRDTLAHDLGLPVAAGHDVRTAGLAEGRLGAGQGLRDFAFVMIGTGIAAALTVDGTVVSGATRAGGEFGHMPVHPDGELCLCGQKGCLEAYASAASIARRHRARGGPALTAAEIGRSGEAPAQEVWAEAVEALALGLASLTMLLDPGAVILGGGLAEAGPRLADPVRAALAARLAWRAPPPIRLSRLGPAAGVFGAAILGWQAAGQDGVVDGWRVGAAGAPDVQAPGNTEGS